jgi:hypothetical protein
MKRGGWSHLTDKPTGSIGFCQATVKTGTLIAFKPL